ncbi:hypothetical protein ILUMI_13183 [Ignelater luminosus]|uniref:Ankyrin repeat protein n=1 Tax=Ignelater luminosus TaxID=2038154 RepID=A0A8K0CX55_IGNLU|nr:hypothetical protein ILUMI_13183 [Ignelater luminosus]
MTIFGSFRRFDALLRMFNLSVNVQNEDGDTPLLTSLKYRVPRQFVERLLEAGAKLTIANKEGITPLTLALALYRTTFLLEKSRYAECLYQTKLSERMLKAIKTYDCYLETFVINSRLDNEKIIIIISIKGYLYRSDNIALMELRVFLDYLEAKDNIKKYHFYKVCERLIRNSLHSNAPVLKMVWKRMNHFDLIDLQSTLLEDFINWGRYENSEFVECLISLLTVSLATYCDARLFPRFFNSLLFRRFSSRNIAKKERIRILLLISNFPCVTFDDVGFAYAYFQFNEEVIILLQILKPKYFYNYSLLNDFIMKLAKDEKFLINNLNNLDFITRACYRRLIFKLPTYVLVHFETDKLEKQKQILNEVPRLFEMSVYASQKGIQKFYDVHCRDQFDKAVQNLCLPNDLKRILRHEPPLYSATYYNSKSELCWFYCF